MTSNSKRVMVYFDSIVVSLKLALKNLDRYNFHYRGVHLNIIFVALASFRLKFSRS